MLSVGAVIFGVAWEGCVVKGSHLNVLPKAVFKGSPEQKSSRKVKVHAKVF